MPDSDDDDIIIIRRAANSTRVSAQDKSFLLEVAALLESSLPVSWLDQWRVRRLLGRVVFG